MKSRFYILAVAAVLLLAVLACGSTSGSGSSSAPLEPVTYKGRGDDVVDCSAITGKAYNNVRMTHDGKANFLVVPFTGTTRRVSLANEIGEYSGTAKWDRRADSLEVDADGAWTITVSQ